MHWYCLYFYSFQPFQDLPLWPAIPLLPPFGMADRVSKTQYGKAVNTIRARLKAAHEVPRGGHVAVDKVVRAVAVQIVSKT